MLTKAVKQILKCDKNEFNSKNKLSLFSDYSVTNINVLRLCKQCISKNFRDLQI